jgi:hypothetical protein
MVAVAGRAGLQHDDSQPTNGNFQAFAEHL